ncbi:MAG: sulfotransferase [Verrucomicrobiales bacterium]
MDSHCIFAQGMRRAGTTILFDLMLEDAQCTCFYEPLAQGKPTLGGGSGVHSDRDLFCNVREQRELFLANHPEWLIRCPDFRERNLLNHGAPRLPELEFEPALPPYCRDYIIQLTKADRKTFLKFTRMHSKVDCLREINPHAKFIHIVRDPRHVTASYMFGKNARFKDEFKDVDHFFERVSNYTAWASRPFSENLLQSPEYKNLGTCQDFLRILIIWKFKFLRTHFAGKRCFGDSYYLLRHEDLLQNPESTLRSLGEFINSPFKESTFEWATNTLKQPTPPFAGADARWHEAFDRINIKEALSEAGYWPRNVG